MQGLFLLIIIESADRQLHRQHRLRDRRPAGHFRDPGLIESSFSRPRADLAAHPGASAHRRGQVARQSLEPPREALRERLHFAFHNPKLVVGLTVCCSFSSWRSWVLWLTDADPFEFGYPLGVPPSTDTGSVPLQWARTCSRIRLRAPCDFIVGALAASWRALSA